MKTTKEEFAKCLNGRQYPLELSEAEIAIAKANNLVVICGYSDDVVSFMGAIEDEAYPNEEDEVWFDRKGVKAIPEEDQEVLEKYGVMAAFMGNARKLVAEYGMPWEFSFVEPIAQFDVLEKEELYCRSIVINLDEIFPSK